MPDSNPPSTESPAIYEGKSGTNQHYVQHMHQRGFADPASKKFKLKKGVLEVDRDQLKAFAYTCPTAKYRPSLVSLTDNFTQDYTYDFEGIRALQADYGVITQEEGWFVSLFKEAQEGAAPTVANKRLAELIVHCFRRSLLVNTYLEDLLFAMWKDCVGSSTLETLMEDPAILLANSKATYVECRTPEARSHFVAGLMWRSLVAQEVQRQGRVDSPLCTAKVVHDQQGRVRHVFKSALKAAWVSELKATPLRGNSIVATLLQSFDFHFQLNPDAANPFILADHPVVYVDKNGGLFKFCPEEKLGDIAQIVGPLSSTCLLRATSKKEGVESYPLLNVDVVNTWIAQAANERYIAPIANYARWLPEIGKAAFMPESLEEGIREPDGVEEWSAGVAELNAMLEAQHAVATSGEKGRLKAAGLAQSVGLLFAPLEHAKGIPPEIGFSGEEGWASIWEQESKCGQPPLAKVEFSVADLIMPLCTKHLSVKVSVPATPETLKISRVVATVWNPRRAPVPKSKTGQVHEVVYSIEGQLSQQEGVLVLGFHTEIGGDAGGDLLITLEGMDAASAVVFRRYVWVSVAASVGENTGE